MREKYKLNADGDVVHCVTGKLFSERAVAPKPAAPVQAVQKGSAMTKQPADPVASLARFLADQAARGQSVRATMGKLTTKQRRTLNINGDDNRIRAALRNLEGGGR